MPPPSKCSIFCSHTCVVYSLYPRRCLHVLLGLNIIHPPHFVTRRVVSLYSRWPIIALLHCLPSASPRYVFESQTSLPLLIKLTAVSSSRCLARVHLYLIVSMQTPQMKTPPTKTATFHAAGVLRRSVVCGG